MKTIIISLFTLLSTISIVAQDKKHTYTQFDVAIPFKGNPNRGEEDPYTHKKESWLLPDGLSAKLGYGMHCNKWLSLGIHTGIDWKGIEKLVVLPVFANLKLSPKIAEETRMYLQAGYGKSFAIGRGNLSGDYKKASLGIENSDGISLFIEMAEYGFTLNSFNKINSISLGTSLTSF